MGSITGTGTLDGNRQIGAATGFSKCQDVLPPVRLVEIHRQEPAGFVTEQGIDAHDMAALEVIENGLILDPDEGLPGTVGAFDGRLFADAFHPFVRTNRRIAFLSGLRADPQNRKNVFSSPEQATKDFQLLLWRKLLTGLRSRPPALSTIKFLKLLLEKS